MNAQNIEVSQDDVLYAFAVEPIRNAQTLSIYLKMYPQFAMELVELSRELDRDERTENRQLTGEDHSRIESAWQKHSKSLIDSPKDPFQTLSIDALRKVASALGVPRQVISAFRDRLVIVSTVPKRFLFEMARNMEISAEVLVEALSKPAAVHGPAILKADSKPDATDPVPFEKVLADAGVPIEMRTILLADD